MNKYLAKEKTPREFKKKYGEFPFSKVFPNWKSTICSKDMIIETKQPLPQEIIDKYKLEAIECEEM